MKGQALNLRTQGLILMVLLLVPELLFVFCQFHFLEQAEANERKQEKTKEVIARASSLLETFARSGESISTFSTYGNAESKALFTQCREKVPKDLRWLRVETSSDSREAELLEKVERCWAEGLSLMEEIQRKVEREPPMVAAQYAFHVRGRLEGLMSEVVEYLHEFHAREWKKLETVSPEQVKRSREQQKLLLLAALVGNIVVAIWLIRGFIVGSITSRLSVLLDNSDRLRQHRMLRAPLAGTDEIAELDRGFHEMWHTLQGEETLITRSQEQVRAIVEQMPIGLMITASPEKAEVIEYANPTLNKLLGFEAGALEGSELAPLFSVASPGKKELPLEDTGEIEGVVRLVARKKDGGEMPVEFSVVDASIGNILRRLATIIDISDKVEVEKMKQAFVAMISHELRTPLTSVAGFLQMLPMGAYGPLEKPAVEAASVAEAQVEKLITLINDLLDLEKLEAGKLELSKARLVLEEVIDGAIDTLFETIEKYDAQVSVDGCQRQVVGDDERLKQVFVKLISCLLPLCDKHEILKIKGAIGQNKMIKVEVNARRLNLSQDQLQGIFDPFQQLSAANGTVSLGLGLPLARAIVAGHGGSCGANPPSGSGTTLWIEVPATD